MSAPSRNISFDSLKFIADGKKYALDFDWLTRNLYMGTHNGDIVACGTQLESSSSATNCAAVVTGQGHVLGIALNPVQG